MFAFIFLQQYEQVKIENEKLKVQVSKMAEELFKFNNQNDSMSARRVSH